MENKGDKESNKESDSNNNENSNKESDSNNNENSNQESDSNNNENSNKEIDSNNNENSNKESDSNNKENSNKEIDLNHCVYAGIIYDTSEVYCHFCGKHLNPEKDSIDEFYPIVPNFFLCLSHYKAFLIDEKFKAQFQSKIRHAFVSTFIKQVFAPPPIPLQSVPLHMPFDLFLPTIICCCSL